MKEIPMLVFGQGPVLAEQPVQNIKMTDIPLKEPKTKIGRLLKNTYTAVRARHWEGIEHPHAQPVSGGMNRWGQEIIGGARELFARNTTSRFVIMGGRTDEAKAKSAESELLERGIVAPFANEIHIPGTETEKDSSNTFENLVNVCNQVLDKPGGPEEVDMLGGTFHLTRMKILMKLFDIKYRNVVGASDVMLYAAQTATETDHVVINEINARHDGNIVYHDTGLTRAVSDFGDQKSSAQKRAEEDLWTRVLLTVPEYSLPYFAKITSDDRLTHILHNYETEFFPQIGDEPSALQNHGIDIGVDSPDLIREKLASIKRVLPGEEERNRWIEEQKQGIGWPEHVEAKFQQILYTQAA